MHAYMRADADAAQCKTGFASPNEVCLPIKHTYSSYDNYFKDIKLVSKCDGGSDENDLDPNSEECKAHRENYFTKMGCPECVDDVLAQWAAAPICSEITTKDECFAKVDIGASATPSTSTASSTEPAETAGAFRSLILI